MQKSTYKASKILAVSVRKLSQQVLPACSCKQYSFKTILLQGLWERRYEQDNCEKSQEQLSWYSRRTNVKSNEVKEIQISLI